MALAIQKRDKMSYLKVWLHIVFSTKNRRPFLNDKIRKKVFQHMRENAMDKGIELSLINGYTDHVHCLISLKSDQNISKVVQLIKGESSFWINKEKLCSEKFAWQENYFAVSIGESQVKSIRKYILNQDGHHKKKSFKEEYSEFIEKYGFEIKKG